VFVCKVVSYENIENCLMYGLNVNIVNDMYVCMYMCIFVCTIRVAT
jgi:hypothetical protein